MENGDGSAMARATWLAWRIAIAVSLAIVFMGSNFIFAQNHNHNDGCDEGELGDSLSRVTALSKSRAEVTREQRGALIRGNSRALASAAGAAAVVGAASAASATEVAGATRAARASGHSEDLPKLPINKISDQDLLTHPALEYDEALAIIEHKQKYGNILSPAELVQCGMSVERIQWLKHLLSLESPVELLRKNWLRQLKESEQSASIMVGGKRGTDSDTHGIRIPFSTLPMGAGSPTSINQSSILMGAQIQWRYHNPKNFSMGFSSQIDAGESIRNGRDIIQKFHIRTGQYRSLDQLVLGRFSLQTGQGLVQGGLAGYWNAPIIWARKTPDWQLAEKRGWDEYRGHTGIGVSFNHKKLGIRWMIAASKERVSARIDSLGIMSSLITDGNFSTATQLKYQFNTIQRHFTAAVFVKNGFGMSLSGYQYNRNWKNRPGLAELSDVYGTVFLYPEVWYTHYHKNGDLQFAHVAMENKFPAIVWGYAKPINKNTDLSLRGYFIHRDFKPPQGLFNQFNNNQLRTSAMYSKGTVGKKSWRWGSEIGKDLLPESNGVRQIHYKHQFQCEHPLARGISFQAMWQAAWNPEAALNPQFAWNPQSGSGNSQSATTNSQSTTGNSQSATGNPLSESYLIETYSGNTIDQWQHRISLEIKIISPEGSPAQGWAAFGNFSIIPATKKSIYQSNHLPLNNPQPNGNNPNNTHFSNLNQSHLPTQYSINPNGEPLSKNSFLYAVTITHRKPFKPLKISGQILYFNSVEPIFFKPLSTPTEINNYILSAKGAAANLLIQYAIKELNQTHIAVRAEIMHKNTTEMPLQPRIFVSLWWK